MKNRIKAALVGLLLIVGVIIVAGTPAYATVYHGCPSGIGCMWVDANGGGTRTQVSVGNSGYNTCHNITDSTNNTMSSFSADYGGGWDLVTWPDFNCTAGIFDGPCHVYTSHFQNVTGPTGSNCENDVTSSYAIVQWN